MRVLLDECIPRTLAREFVGHQVQTVPQAGWAGKSNGEDGVCTLRGRDAQHILEQEFGVRYSLSTAYSLLHALGLSCLAPRPRHEKNNQAAMARFKESAPFLSRR